MVYSREKLVTFNSLQAQSNQKKQQDTFDAQDMTQIKWLLAYMNINLTLKLIIKAYQELAKYLQRNNSKKALAGYDEKIREFIIRFSSNNEFPSLLVKIKSGRSIWNRR
jgi:hypothetical protein